MSAKVMTGWFPVFLISLGHFFSDFYNNFLPVLLPLIAMKLNLSLTLSGIIVMVYVVVSNVVQPLFGYYVDKKGFTWVLLWTLPISAVFICLIGIANHLSILILCLILAAVGSSLFHPVGTSMLGRISPEKHKALSMSVFIGGGNFGFAVAPAAVVFFLNDFGAGSLLWLAVPAIVLSILYYQQNLHNIKLAVSTVEHDTAWYKSMSLWQLNAVMALKCCVQVTIPTFLPLLWVQQGVDSVTIGNVLTIFFVGAAVGGLIGGYFGDLIGDKRVIVLSLGICVPILYLYYANGISISGWFMLALIGALLQGTMPSSIVWAQKILPANAAMASGMMLGLSFGIGGIGTAITGILADIVGIKQALYLLLIPLVLAVGIAYMTPYKVNVMDDKLVVSK